MKMYKHSRRVCLGGSGKSMCTNEASVNVVKNVGPNLTDVYVTDEYGERILKMSVTHRELH